MSRLAVINGLTADRLIGLLVQWGINIVLIGYIITANIRVHRIHTYVKLSGHLSGKVANAPNRLATMWSINAGDDVAEQYNLRLIVLVLRQSCFVG